MDDKVESNKAMDTTRKWDADREKLDRSQIIKESVRPTGKTEGKKKHRAYVICTKGKIIQKL